VLIIGHLLLALEHGSKSSAERRAGAGGKAHCGAAFPSRAVARGGAGVTSDRDHRDSSQMTIVGEALDQRAAARPPGVQCGDDDIRSIRVVETCHDIRHRDVETGRCQLVREPRPNFIVVYHEQNQRPDQVAAGPPSVDAVCVRHWTAHDAYTYTSGRRHVCPVCDRR